jgi:hypothetical protein
VKQGWPTIGGEVAMTARVLVGGQAASRPARLSLGTDLAGHQDIVVEVSRL